MRIIDTTSRHVSKYIKSWGEAGRIQLAPRTTSCSPVNSSGVQDRIHQYILCRK